MIAGSPEKLKDHINRTGKEEFYYYNLKHRFHQQGAYILYPEENPRYGFLGTSSLPKSSESRISFSSPEGFSSWSEIDIFLRTPVIGNSEFSYHVSLKAGDNRYAQDVNVAADTLKKISFTGLDTKSVEINFASSSSPMPYVDLVNLEAESGLVYSTVVRMGNHMSWLMSSADKFKDYGFSELKPDLLILQYGINEAASLETVKIFTEDVFRSQMSSCLDYLKKILPETDILIIAPYEVLKKERGILVQNRFVNRVREIQMEEAAKAGVAFFDTYGFMGGKGQMKRFVSQRLANSDYTHVTTKGGNLIGEKIFQELEKMKNAAVGGGSLLVPLSDEIDHSEKKSSIGAIQFNSISFAVFLIIVFIVSSLLLSFPGYRIIFLVLSSYYFYMTWMAWPVLLLIFSSVLDYFAGLQMYREKTLGNRGTLWLALSLAGNLGLLFVFKYFNFFSGLTGNLFNLAGYQVTSPTISVILPVGISFYTFQTLSYSIDIWRGKTEPKKNFWQFAMYVSFFPQLVAGPIVRASEFLPNLNSRLQHFSVKNTEFLTGIFLILTGLVKKMSADWLAVNIVDRVFESPEMFSSLETLGAVYSYALQIYGDFSGYTDIALGSAMLLGYNLTVNFRRPYQSVTVTDFWRRWHISLGSWFRDYLYISLGGNRKRLYLNLFITMLICGLWHGAALNFVIWGIYHGMFLIIERKTGLAVKPVNSFTRIVRIFITFHITVFGWIIFRASSFANFKAVIDSLCDLTFYAPNLDAVILSVMGILYLVHFSPINWKNRVQESWINLSPVLQGAIASCTFILLYNIAVADVKPFIYFQF